MLELTVHDGERNVVLRFEHSLRSLSKWESKFTRPFMGKQAKTADEMIHYYQDMLISPKADRDLIYMLEPEQLEAIGTYINTSQTASTVPQDGSQKAARETVTSELIYYWLTAMKINWECQDWHLTRTMALIEITNYKSQPEDKKNKKKPAETMDDWRAINERQRKMFNTSG